MRLEGAVLSFVTIAVNKFVFFRFFTESEEISGEDETMPYDKGNNLYN